MPYDPNNDSIPPELLQALSEAGLLDDRLAQAQWARGHGDRESQTPMPEGRNIQPGFQASNPMEVWAAALKQRNGNQEMAQSQRAIADMIRQVQQTALAQYQNHQAQEKISTEGAGPYTGEVPERDFDPSSHTPVEAPTVRTPPPKRPGVIGTPPWAIPQQKMPWE